MILFMRIRCANHQLFLASQPYITKAIFSTPEPPVKLTKIAIGNGAMGAEPEYEVVPAVRIRLL